MTESLPLALAACFAGGIALGFVYFGALRETARLIVAQGNPLIGLALTLGRAALLCVGLYVAVQAGGFALLAMLAGVLTAKAIMLRVAP